MNAHVIQLKSLTELNAPVLICGFSGWGNALDVSRSIIDYLIRDRNAEKIAKMDPDPFYKIEDQRPTVTIENGVLKGIEVSEPGFFAFQEPQSNRNILLFKAAEPHFHWTLFIETMLDFCVQAGVKKIISIGSMYDNVLHTDTIISAIASDESLLSLLEQSNILRANYEGPSAIHTSLHHACIQMNMESVSLWCHCPSYLQGTAHFGLLSHLGSLLASLCGFSIETDELDTAWAGLQKQIDDLVEKTPEIKEMIRNVRKAQIRGRRDALKTEDKIIHLEDFQKPWG